MLLEAIGTLKLGDDRRGSHRICQKTSEMVKTPSLANNTVAGDFGAANAV